MLNSSLRATRSFTAPVSFLFSSAVLLLGSLLLTGSTATAQTSQALPLLTQRVDNASRVTLDGTIHRLAKSQYDRGAVEPSLQAPRVQLMLKRPADREAALKQFIADAHTKGSASYHKWVTPDQFGKLYGPADSDIAGVTAWLQSEGLTVNKVSRGKSLIEFGGSVGQIQAAFGTPIHKYVVNGETHYANSKAISIPVALAPVVRGVVSLNNFKLKSEAKVLGHGTYSPKTHKGTGDWNVPDEGVFYVAPGDFAVQYDTAPLVSAGTNGKGVTIGIINDSNIDIALVNAYRALFSLPASTPQVVIDGNDPGVNSDSIEAYLDVEQAGAVAPGATINLYTAADTALIAGLDLATARAVDDDQAQILNLSFGGCEALLGSENAFYAFEWEQAAAQGQSVTVSSGDSASEGCYNSSDTSPTYGLAVNGSASTPYNIAVGGTDFYYSDYASTQASSLPASFSTYWTDPLTQTNTPATTIAQYIPEQPWNNSKYGLNVAVVNGFASASLEPSGGGGGASSCSTQDSSGACTAGYAKPSYQSSVTPADSVRDIPDVSLFAANGYNLSAYPICAFPGDCNSDGQVVDTSQSPVVVTGVGGTSAAAPSFAGILAMVVQQYGSQGQANYTLYPLQQQFPAAFHDVTVGTNNSPCPAVGAGDGCTTDASGGGISVQNYAAKTGYDEASGLGSVDANVLIADWNKVTFTGTTTTLALSPASITHGATVTLTANVASTSATGDVAFTTTAPIANNTGLGFATLASGVATVTSPSTTVSDLPGGTYSITAQYEGDGTYAPSASTAQTITVTPEASTAYAALVDYYQEQLITTGSSVPYGTAVAVEVQPIGTAVSQTAGATIGSLSSDGAATGSVSFTDGTTSATIPLDAAGLAEWNPGTFAVGTHSVVAKYSGDASFNASTSTALAFTVVKGTPLVNVEPLLTSQAVGSNLTVQVVLCNGETSSSGTGCGLGGGSAPTGTVAVALTNGATVLQTQTGTITNFTAASGIAGSGNYSSATVTFTSVPANATGIGATYSGDNNWNTASGSSTFSTSAALAVSTTSLSVTPASGTTNASALTFTSTVTGTSAVPTGSVQVYFSGTSVNALTLPLSGGTTSGNAVTVTTTLAGDTAYGGTNQFVAVYSGDTVYAGSSSAPVTATVDESDFNMVTTNPVLALAAGASGTAPINLNSIAGFNGTVNLTCTAATGLTCAVAPASVTLNGAASATVTITSGATAAALHDPLKPFWYAGGGIALACMVFFGVPARNRSWRSMLGLLLFAAVTFNFGCGGSSSSGGGGSTQTATPTFTPVAGTYASTQSVTIADSTSGATIYYTTDGSTPTTASTVYSSAISVAKTETISALAVASGDTASTVASAAYTISAASGGTNRTFGPAVAPNTVVVTATAAAGNGEIHSVVIQVAAQ